MSHKSLTDIAALQKAAERAWKRYTGACQVADRSQATTEEVERARTTHTSVLGAMDDWQNAKHDLCPKCSGMCANLDSGEPCGRCGGTGKGSEKWTWSRRDRGGWQRCAICRRNHIVWDRGLAMNALLPTRRRRTQNLCIECFREAVGAKDPRAYQP